MRVFKALIAGAAIMGFVAVASANIVGSPHDLSSGSGGAEFNTSRVCVFCHYPHNANPAVPLWNHELSTNTYNLYRSTTMDSTYASGTSDAVNLANTSSGLCLSCHDGSVAINSLQSGHNFPLVATGNVIDSGTLTLLAGASINIGTDLTNDHPVDIVYGGSAVDPDLNDTTQVVCGTVTVGDLLRPGNGGNNNTVQCTSCHEPHKAADGTQQDICGTVLTQSFMRIDVGGSALCLACHNK